MTQITPEEMQRRGALLKKAKQILIQEYAAIRTQQHQQWIRDSESSWRTNGVLMAYPPGKLYPSEQEIVDKALELYNKSLIPTTPEIKLQDDVGTIFNATTPDPTTTPDLPATVTEQLEAVYKKGSIYPNLIEQLSAITPDKNIEPVTSTTDIVEPVVEETPVVDVEPETIIPEPTKDIETESETSIEVSVTPKHSLLRSVLSGWLSKNKDKEA